MSEEMKEEVFDGEEMMYIIGEAQAIKEWNSVRCWVNGSEVNLKDVEMIFYNSEQEDGEVEA